MSNPILKAEDLLNAVSYDDFCNAHKIESEFLIEPMLEYKNFTLGKYNNLQSVTISPFLLSIVEKDAKLFDFIVNKINPSWLKNKIQIRYQTGNARSQEGLKFLDFIVKPFERSLEGGKKMAFEYLNNNVNEIAIIKDPANGTLNVLEEKSVEYYNSDLSDNIALILNNNWSNLLPLFYMEMTRKYKDVLVLSLRKSSPEMFTEVCDWLSLDVLNQSKINYSISKLKSIRQTNITPKNLQEIQEWVLIPKNVMQYVASATKNTEENIVSKMKIIFNSEENGHQKFITVLQDKASGLSDEKDIYVQIKEDKSYPFVNAIHKKMPKIIKLFLDLGYEPNSIENRELLLNGFEEFLKVSDKKELMKEDLSNDIIKQKTLSIFNKLNKGNVSLLQKIMTESSEEEKQDIFNVLYAENTKSYPFLNVSPSLLDSKKSIVEDIQLSPVERAIKLGCVEILNILMENGYKLNDKQFMLSWFTFIKMASLSDNPEETRISYDNFAKNLSVYPDEYKKMLLNLYIKGLHSKDLKNYSSLNFNSELGLGDFLLTLTNNKKIELSNTDIIMWSAMYDGDLTKEHKLCELLIDVYMLKFYPEELNKTIDLPTFKKQVITSCLKKLTADNVKNSYNKEMIEGIIKENINDFSDNNLSNKFTGDLVINITRNMLKETMEVQGGTKIKIKRM